MRPLLQKWLHAFDVSESLRFVVVGMINTGFSYLIYAALLYAGLNFALANLGAVIMGILFSFQTQGRLVFHNSEQNLFARFFVSWIVIYAITISLIGCLVLYGIDPYTGGLLALPISAVCSYFIQKYFVFKKRPDA